LDQGLGDAFLPRFFGCGDVEVEALRSDHFAGGGVIVDADGWPLAGGAPNTGPVTIVAECRLADALS
jgi:hypothetical protein